MKLKAIAGKEGIEVQAVKDDGSKVLASRLLTWTELDVKKRKTFWRSQYAGEIELGIVSRKKTKPCVACGGKGLSSKGEPCVPCRGTGKVPKKRRTE